MWRTPDKYSDWLWRKWTRAINCLQGSRLSCCKASGISYGSIIWLMRWSRGNVLSHLPAIHGPADFALSFGFLLAFAFVVQFLAPSHCQLDLGASFLEVQP